MVATKRTLAKSLTEPFCKHGDAVNLGPLIVRPDDGVYVFRGCSTCGAILASVQRGCAPRRLIRL
jgi:hypothetical protein